MKRHIFFLPFLEASFSIPLLKYCYKSNSPLLTSRSCISSTKDLPDPTDAKPLLKLSGAPVAESMDRTVYLISHAKIAAPSSRWGEAASTYHELPVAFEGRIFIDTLMLGNKASSEDSATTNETSPMALPSSTVAEFVTIAWIITYRGKKCLMIVTSGKCGADECATRALNDLDE